MRKCGKMIEERYVMILMSLFLYYIIQVPKIRVSSASESISGTRKVSPGPKSADSRGQEEEQGRTDQDRIKTCNYRIEACMYN